MEVSAVDATSTFTASSLSADSVGTGIKGSHDEFSSISLLSSIATPLRRGAPRKAGATTHEITLLMPNDTENAQTRPPTLNSLVGDGRDSHSSSHLRDAAVTCGAWMSACETQWKTQRPPVPPAPYVTAPVGSSISETGSCSATGLQTAMSSTGESANNGGAGCLADEANVYFRLLQTELELRETRRYAEVREQEVTRLLEVVSIQKEHIAELRQNLAKLQPARCDTATGTSRPATSGRRCVPGKDRSSDAMQQRGLASVAVQTIDTAALLDGLSVGDVKQTVRCAVEALGRVEAQLRAETRRAAALKRENSELRNQLARAMRRGNGGTATGTACAREVACDTVATFLQGPLRRFLTESVELHGKMTKMGHTCT
ncbi:hypothetical protein ERJ75_001199700 [Trypanosoma vivax]|uniref:Uncharacterized protein n=1 Tax=Trypanosoma vivax (strain Y486) TaxID=1055687 RepID=G0UBN3_TRYVY|nr:hypothetical protein TRVL_08114 [Trypanosoma vivax]KAH8609492.1 hypothetical protein ERJ75_001199700 [Trypanosoma vivax]CCC53230.1 conserved hypothetical protein [Trypanosoma vivax Y486]